MPPISARLVARACGEHDEAGHGLRLRHRRGEDADAVGELRAFEDGHRAMVDTASRLTWNHGARCGQSSTRVPTALLVLLVVGGVVGAVLLAALAVRRFVPATREGFDAEVSSQMLGVVASLFGLLLAFVVVIEFQAFSAAGDNVQTEADGLAAITRDSCIIRRAGRRGGARRDRRLPSGRGERGVRVDARGQGEPGCLGRPGRRVRGDAGRHADGGAQESFYDDSVRRLNVVLDARRDRLEASADSDLPLVIAALISWGRS